MRSLPGKRSKLDDGESAAATGLDSTVVHSLSHYPPESAHTIIYHWYIKERERIKRRTEFAIEVPYYLSWFFQCTPL